MGWRVARDWSQPCGHDMRRKQRDRMDGTDEYATIDFTDCIVDPPACGCLRGTIHLGAIKKFLNWTIYDLVAAEDSRR